MKSWAFLISGIVELVGGIAIYFKPQLVFDSVNMTQARIYGIAALVIGIVNLIFWRKGRNTELERLVFLSMMFFHAALSFVCYSASTEEMSARLGACLTHLAVFVLFFVSYMAELKPSE